METGKSGYSAYFIVIVNLSNRDIVGFIRHVPLYKSKKKNSSLLYKTLEEYESLS